MVFMVENIPKKDRMWIQNSITWSPNLILLPFVAWLCHDWRTLSLVTAASSLLTFVVILVLEESPRWLLQKGQLDLARDALIRIRKTDGLYNPEFLGDLDDVLRIEFENRTTSTECDKKYTFYHLFCTWKMMAQTLTFITGMLERLLIRIEIVFLFQSLNQVFMIFTLLSLAAMITWITVGDSESGGHVMAIGTTVAVAMCSQLFIAKYLIVNELYPTAVRNIAVSAVSTMSRIGSMFSPQLFYLSDYADWLPYVVLFTFQLYDLVVLSIFLPETKGVTLVNHLPPKEMRILGRRRRNDRNQEQL